MFPLMSSHSQYSVIYQQQAMKHLALLVLSVSALAYSSNACQFGSEGIQAVYDRFQLFKNTKAFDPTDSVVPLEQYEYSDTDGEKRLAVRINGTYLTEYYTIDGDNKIKTKSGTYLGRLNFRYERDENGEFSFDDWPNSKKFKLPLQSIDAELPSDVEDEYKEYLVLLITLRTKMFEFQASLSQEDVNRIRLFSFSSAWKLVFNRFGRGNIFYARYIENDGGSLSFSNQNGSDDISDGRFSCDHMDQKYSIMDGKVVVDGVPFVPVYD